MKFLLNFIFRKFSKIDKERIFKNFISQINTNLIRTLIQISFPPLMIYTYGLEIFGIWIFLLSIPSILSIFNFNINEAAKIEMSIHFNNRNYSMVNKIFNNSIISSISLIILLLAITIIFFIFFQFDLEILELISANKNLILISIFLVFFIDLFNGIFVTSITFFGRIDINSYLEIFFDFFGKFLVIIIGLISGELLIASYAFLGNSLIKIVTYYYFYIKLNKKFIYFNSKLFSKKEIFRLIKLSIPHYLETIVFIIRNSFQIILLGIFFNAYTVGMISSLKTLFFFLPIRLWGILSKLLLYEFTKSLTSKKIYIFKKIFKKIFLIVSIFLIIYLFLCITLGNKIFSIWLNNTYQVDLLLIFLICIDAVILILGSSFKLIGKSVNKFSLIVNIDLIISFIIIFISTLLFMEIKNYYLIFLLNITGSIIYAFVSVFYSINLLKKISK